MKRGTNTIQREANNRNTKKRLTLIEPPTLGSLQRERFMEFEREYDAYAKRMKAIGEVAEERWELVESNLAAQLMIINKQISGGDDDEEGELTNAIMDTAIKHLFRIKDLGAQQRTLANYQMKGVGLPALGDYVVSFKRISALIQADEKCKAIAKVFVNGLSSLLRGKVIPYECKTLEEAIEKAYEIELQISEALEIVKTQPGPQQKDGYKKQPPRREKGRFGRNAKNSKETRVCYNCHEKGHLAKDCSNSKSHQGRKTNVCWRCGEEGHFANDPKCPKNSNTNKN